MLILLAAAGGCLAFGGPLVGEEGEDEQAGDESGDGTEGEAGTETGTEHECGPTQGVVDRVVDGDTIVLVSGERIRYILVDTPELGEDKNECWGAQAADYNAALVVNREVTIEYDAECEDQFGRLLAYVHTQGIEVNRTLLEQGQACLLHIPPNGDARVIEYQGLEDAAKQDQLGMWGACGTVRCD